MQTWTKRGLQTALVTGGLLALGTGIAAADDGGNPDKPAGPLDLSVSVPVHAKDNVLGTPLGQKKAPDVDREIEVPSVNDMTSGLDPAQHESSGDADSASASDSDSQAGESAQSPEPSSDDADSDTDHATSTATRTAHSTDQTKSSKAEDSDSGSTGLGDEDVARGNKLSGNVTVPVELCGNAVGVGGDAETSGSCEQDNSNDQDIDTTSDGQSLGGNVGSVAGNVPVQVTGNAAGVLGGDARSDYQASQSTENTGDITTDGQGAPGAGNVLAAHPSVPVELNGVAGSGLVGSAQTASSSENASKAGGSIATNGDDSVASGNAGGVPIGLPVEANDVAGGAFVGDSEAKGKGHTTETTAGEGTPDPDGIPVYTRSSGKNSVVGGNNVAPELAGPIAASGIAGSGALGKASSAPGDAAGKAAPAGNENTISSGGASATDGTGSAVGGNAGHAPVAFPVQLCGIGGSALGGLSGADCASKTDSRAGGAVAEGDGPVPDTYSLGDDSVVGGNLVTSPLANSADLCGIGGAYIGKATGNCGNDVTAHAGGDHGTRGNDSSLGGNLVDTPVAIPAEVFGIGASHIGQASGTGEEKKDLGSGGDGSSDDDNGFGAANIVSSPVSLPAQAFGIGGTYIGQATGKGTTETTAVTGGDQKASGKNSSASANVVQAPLAGPLQVFGIGGSHIGNAAGEGAGKTSTTAGGDTTTTGEGSSLAGNVLGVPTGGQGQLFGDAASVIGNATGKGVNEADSTAGGDTTANGDGGAGSGNVITSPLNPIAQGFGVDGHLLGLGSAEAVNGVQDKVGGDVTTSGQGGSGAGNVLYGPGQGLGQLFGDALAGGGIASGSGINGVESVNGGDVTTNGNEGSLAGNIGAAQIEPILRGFGLGGAGFGNAEATAVDATNLTNGGDLTTTGQNGSGAGNIFDLPAVVSPQAYGDGAGLVANVLAGGVDNLNVQNAGTDTTSEEDAGRFAGVNQQLPLSLDPELYSVALPLLSNVEAVGVPGGEITNAGETVDRIPFDGSSLPGADQLPTLPAPGQLPQVGDRLPSLPGADQLPGTGAKQAADHSPAGNEPLPTAHTLPLYQQPRVQDMLGKVVNVQPGSLQSVPGLGTKGGDAAGLPSVEGLPQATDLPALPKAGQLPTMDGDTLPALGGFDPTSPLTGATNGVAVGEMDPTLV